jgi:CubicO group peptidase (beta-lactamase class C family)
MNKEELHSLIEEEQPNICQIFVYKAGVEVYSDEWNNYKKRDCTHIMSATKSIVALLIGIAIDQGLIHSVDDSVLDYFPHYTVKRGEKTIHEVTIKHLLTMRAPYKCKGDPWTKVCSSNDWTFSITGFAGRQKRDQRGIQLSDGLLAYINRYISNEVTKMTPVDYANTGISLNPSACTTHKNYYAETAEEHKEFTMNKKAKGKCLV